MTSSVLLVTLENIKTKRRKYHYIIPETVFWASKYCVYSGENATTKIWSSIALYV